MNYMSQVAICIASFVDTVTQRLDLGVSCSLINFFLNSTREKHVHASWRALGRPVGCGHHQLSLDPYVCLFSPGYDIITCFDFASRG